jgi:hypothetical protein
MNEIVKKGLWLLAGVVIGATGARLTARKESIFRGVVVGTIAKGISVKEKVTTSLEKARENVEDIVAEAKYVQTGGNREKDQPDKTDS